MISIELHKLLLLTMCFVHTIYANDDGCFDTTGLDSVTINVYLFVCVVVLVVVVIF